MSARITQVLAVVGLVCIVGALVVAFSDGLFSAGLPRKLLDAELPLRSEGTTWTCTVDEPGVVMLVVDMPAGCTKDGRLSVSPLYLALRPDPVYEPGREPEHALVIPHGGLASTPVELARAGAYVLRLDPIPMAMGNEGNPPRARIRVLKEP